MCIWSLDSLVVAPDAIVEVFRANASAGWTPRERMVESTRVHTTPRKLEHAQQGWGRQSISTWREASAAKNRDSCLKKNEGSALALD